jgi:hypothetical protein
MGWCMAAGEPQGVPSTSPALAPACHSAIRLHHGSEDGIVVVLNCKEKHRAKMLNRLSISKLLVEPAAALPSAAAGSASSAVQH